MVLFHSVESHQGFVTWISNVNWKGSSFSIGYIGMTFFNLNIRMEVVFKNWMSNKGSIYIPLLDYNAPWVCLCKEISGRSDRQKFNHIIFSYEVQWFNYVTEFY